MSNAQRRWIFRVIAWIVADGVFIACLFLLLADTGPTGVDFAIAHALGIGIATVVMFTGVGGGVLWFPIFIWLGCGPRDAVMLSLFTQIAGKGSGTIRYLRQGMVDLLVGRHFLPYALAGVFAGFVVGRVIPERIDKFLLLLFALTVFYLFWLMIRTDDGQARGDDNQTASSLPAGGRRIVVTASFFTGLLSIGNSDWLIPYMERRMKMAMNRAVATGIFVMFYSAVFFLAVVLFTVASGQTPSPGHLHLLWGTCSGVIIGGQIGAGLVNFEFVRRHQKRVFAIVLLLAGLDMIRAFLSG